ncbi:MAG TPA: hypothetical protein VLB68_10315 [Pyrinomonadaceae bacterium]|nr:hypothetical protein [Pyrinomonadaceae bacterium]
MSNEEFERKMTFIVAQQAQFAADIQQLQAAQAKTENVVGRLANATLAGFNDVTGKIEVLVDSQIRTDESLRNLIAVVDRYFREGRNVK